MLLSVYHSGYFNCARALRFKSYRIELQQENFMTLSLLASWTFILRD